MLKTIHNKEHIKYLADQLNFAKRNKLEVDKIYFWFENEDTQTWNPNKLEVHFRSAITEEA
jgi:uncharacterized protein YbaP (TraB family)